MQIRILVVDDEKETGDYLQLLLTKAGYEVVALTDPTQVMDRLRAEDFHLVILDMMMPQMSGTEVLEKIRELRLGHRGDRGHRATPRSTPRSPRSRRQASRLREEAVRAGGVPRAVDRRWRKKGLSKDPEAELHRVIGRTIREAAQAQSLTLKQLARRTGLSVSLLSPDRARRVERLDLLALQDRLGAAAADGRAVRRALTNRGSAPGEQPGVCLSAPRQRSGGRASAEGRSGRQCVRVLGGVGAVARSAASVLRSRSGPAGRAPRAAERPPHPGHRQRRSPAAASAAQGVRAWPRRQRARQHVRRPQASASRGGHPAAGEEHLPGALQPGEPRNPRHALGRVDDAQPRRRHAEHAPASPTRKSQAQASSQPAPKAAPCDQATAGRRVLLEQRASTRRALVGQPAAAASAPAR